MAGGTDASCCPGELASVGFYIGDQTLQGVNGQSHTNDQNLGNAGQGNDRGKVSGCVRRLLVEQVRIDGQSREVALAKRVADRAAYGQRLHRDAA